MLIFSYETYNVPRQYCTVKILDTATTFSMHITAVKCQKIVQPLCIICIIPWLVVFNIMCCSYYWWQLLAVLCLADMALRTVQYLCCCWIRGGFSHFIYRMFHLNLKQPNITFPNPQIHQTATLNEMYEKILYIPLIFANHSNSNMQLETCFVYSSVQTCA